MSSNNFEEESIDHFDPSWFEVKDRGDIDRVKNEISNIAEKLGLSSRRKNIVLALKELCTNLLKHSGGGEVGIQTPTPSDELDPDFSTQKGIEITVRDSGPGIKDVPRAFKDGFSRTNSRGEGLGKVNQAVDGLDISTGPEGTEITFRVWSRTSGKTDVSSSPPLDFGFATRKHPAMDQNGDAFIIKTWKNKSLVGVIDGVGHGEQAKLASVKACEYIESHYNLDLESILRGTNRACRGTRGVVVGLVKLSWDQSVLVEFAGIGNIECSIITPEEKHSLISKRGLLGKSLPSPEIISKKWSDMRNRLMLLQSDGLKSHWEIDDFDATYGESAPKIAHEHLSRLARSDDDATVAVIKYEPNEE